MSKSFPVSEYGYRRRVQFAEVDAARIAHFSHFFRYMEEAEHAMWREAGLSIASPDEAFGYVRVGASFEFHAPLRFEDECDVRIRIVKIGRSSMGYACAVTRGEERIATGAMTIVCTIRGEDGRRVAAPFPAVIRERFAVAGSES